MATTNSSTTKTTQVYAINKIKTLVELNRDAVNFHLVFKVKGNGPFSIAILDQNTLDTTESIRYQEIKNGDISGELSWQKNIYSPYFMVLKSNEPNEVTVELTLTQFPITVNSSSVTSADASFPVTDKEESISTTTTTTQTTNKKYIYIIGCVVAIGVLYYLFNNSSRSKLTLSGIRDGLGVAGKPSLLSKLKQAQSLNLP